MLESVAAECSVAHSLQLLQALSAVNATEQLVPHIICGPLVVAKLLVVLASFYGGHCCSRCPDYCSCSVLT